MISKDKTTHSDTLHTPVEKLLCLEVIGDENPFPGRQVEVEIIASSAVV